ncbi:MAG TPA: hypothetical protein VD813_01125 [Pseudonocardia sp.]|nr:hypothetical protein [Pseudonocardia sp.]
MSAVVAVALVLLAMTPGGPPPSAPPAPPPPGQADLALDAENCVATAQTVEDVAQAIADAGGPRGEGVVHAIERAESRIEQRLDTPDERLTATFAEVGGGLYALRAAITADTGVRAATENLIGLIDRLDQRCRDVLGGRPGGGG